MNKTKKLLSVLLAVLIALSCMSVMASAAKANYQSVENLTAAGAYSPYGQVTRLSTEERTSIILDALEGLLAPMSSLNMGTLINVLGLKVVINLTSIDGICESFDSIKSTFNNTLFGIAKGIVNLGVLENVKVDTWASGMTRAGTAQFTILSEILEVLSAQKDVIYSVVSSGNLDLGILGSALGDISAVTDLIGDLPGLIKGLVWGLFERWDDTVAEIQNYETTSKGNGGIINTLNTFVKNLFTKDMTISTVKLDANGNITSDHNLPTTGVRVIYEKSGNILTAKSYATQKYVDAQEKLGNTVAKGSYYVSAKYVLEQEVGTEDYVWHQVNLDEDGNMKTLDDGSYDYVGGETPNLKYYEINSPLLPGISGADIDLTTMSAGDLLYTFIPVVFENMAPVVLNGSVKKILAEFFGAKFNFVGKLGSDEVNALGTNAFFTEEQGEYLWEWSNYAIIDGVHYYRYLDDFYVGDISNKNNYFDIINWDFEITGDFLNEFIPASAADANTQFINNINNFLIKVATTVVKPSAETADTLSDYTKTWTMPNLTKGGNENLVANIKAFAQAAVSLAPQHIFGDDYATNPRCYYAMFMSTDNDTILAGIAAQLVDIIMPSMTLPTAEELMAANAKVGAILAAVVREFAAQLTPEYNYDALIYADFGTTEADPVKTFLAGKDSNYWLDVILTMGINVGFEYIRGFADMGEGTAAWDNFVAYSGYAEKKTFTEADLMLNDATANYWEGMVDYVVDWALANEEWAWKMGNIVNISGLTVGLGTKEDPWAKLQQILGSILPVDEILTVETTEYATKMEQFLRHDFILALVDLRWEDIFATVKFNGPNQYFRNTNVLNQLATLVKGIVNSLLVKVGGGSFKLIPDAVKTFDDLANQGNIATLAQGLVGALYTAGVTNKGCDTLLPFLNFLLGWKTDPQRIADPEVWHSFRDGNDYAFQWQENGVYPSIEANETLINIRNNSSGMLEIHRHSDKVDQAYEMHIKSVTSDATVNTLTFTFSDGNGIVSPYETIQIKIGGTYKGEEAVTVTIAYEYIGKDGVAVGGTQYITTTFLISNQYEDANVSGRFSEDDDKDYTGTDDFKRYHFTEDIYDTVVNYQARIFYVGSTLSNPDRDLGTIAAPDYDDPDSCKTGDEVYYDITGTAANYFAFRAKDSDAGWAGTLSKDGTSSTYGYLYKAKSGVTADTEFPYGKYTMGRIAVAYGGDNKQYQIDFIYYNDYDIYDVYTANVGNGYHAYQGVASDIYNRYHEAWNELVYCATYPMMTEANGNSATDYVKTIQPRLEGVIEEFEAAKEAYEEALAEASASNADAASRPAFIDALDAQMKKDDNDGEKEINFQDYEYYEYFNYADLRTIGRNMVGEYEAPKVMDTYYILNSGISEAELNKVVAAEGSASKAAGILASRMENDEALIAASIEAVNNWEMPTYGKLNVEDLTARIAYYKSFVNDNVKEDADHMYFLEKEIAHVEAQGFEEADYEAVSWARYAEALAEAKAVVNGTDEYASFNSRIFDVKWELMNARKQLLKNEDSLIQAGKTADLLANIEIAEAIFASMDAADGTYALAADYEGTADEAFAALISALGYYYVGEDGNRWNLYADSAYEYADNDRPNRSGNVAKVNAANAALEAAIANFEMTAVAAPELGAVDGTTGAFGEVVTDEETGFTTGYLYGVTAGEAAEGYFALVDETAGTVEWSLGTASSVSGTGAIATVKDTKGNAVAEFTLVIFGDVNGDATITAADANLVSNVTVGGAINGDANNFAADANGDASISAADANLIANVTVGGNITVNPYAA